VTVTGEEIRLQLRQIQRNLSNTMGAVDETQDPLLSTDLRKSLEWESNGW
jgi:hypothetical protein